ncbi:MAG TPA: DUF1398 family protein [Rhizomicrobium sp.]|jgi:uncharacterized protein YbcV (DUF1398 family)|nr:DUF1398 family protein [Rhizomicrobium sp.]
MNVNAKAVAHECSALSDEGSASFAEIVGRLGAAQVERYHADLTRAEKTYYWPDGASEQVPNAPIAEAPAARFSPESMKAAVRAAQAGTVRYKEFCALAAASGCVGYDVFIAGKRVVYYGRTGDSHVEWFPGAQPSP